MSQLPAPFNFQAWIDEHRDQLKPPVANKQVFEQGDFIIMVVGGPNSRTDYHYDEGEELFYQLEGEMVLKTIQDGEVVDIPIKAGEMFLLPPKVHHSPQRMANSIGLVIERTRRDGEMDGFIWYCENCNHKLHEVYLPLKDIEKDLPPVFNAFYSDEQARTCDECGTIMPAPNK